MPTDPELMKPSHLKGFREEIGKASQVSKDTFFTWFDRARDTDMAFIRGQWDFTAHIALPLAKYISKPEEKVIVEIGHGGGRLLKGACCSFKQCIGVDIHDQNGVVETELINRGVNNFKLYQTDGKSIPVESALVDVVYSFIVLQHVEKIGIFKAYLEETYRVLKPGGVAILYFGRKHILSINRRSWLLYRLDCLLEWLILHRGYKELSARVNSTNLVIRLGFAKHLARKAGFDVLGSIPSHKRVPDGVTLFGGQNGIILRKK